MRISDWSSDVCSSDLVATDVARGSGQRVIRVTPSAVGRKPFLSLSIIICRMQAADLIDGIEEYEGAKAALVPRPAARSEEHTSELQSLMRISYAVFCLKKKTHNN